MPGFNGRDFQTRLPMLMCKTHADSQAVSQPHKCGVEQLRYEGKEYIELYRFRSKSLAEGDDGEILFRGLFGVFEEMFKDQLLAKVFQQWKVSRRSIQSCSRQ